MGSQNKGPGLMDALAEDSIIVTAVAEQLGEIHSAIQRFSATAGGLLPRAPDGTWWAQLATAIGEIGANIVRHAHPPGSNPGAMRLQLRLYTDRVEARFTDDGLPYVAPERPTDLPNSDALDLPEGGYGLMIARAALDRLQYRRTSGGVNVWRLLKRLPG